MDSRHPATIPKMMMPDLDFGHMFDCPLVNTKLRQLKFPIKAEVTARILIISDSHLGAVREPEAEKQKFYADVAAVVAAESPTHFFHLGDVVQGLIPDGARHLQDVLMNFAQFKIPTWVLGGNHDREFGSLVKLPRSSVTLCTENAILLDIQGTASRKPIRIFLAHDLENNYRVRDQLAFSFLTWMKAGFSKSIGAEDWLITGHCHYSFISRQCKVACVGQFSPEIGAWGYAMITVADRVTIELKNCIGK